MTADQAQGARTMPDRSISQVARNARVTSPHPARRLLRRSPIGDTSCPRNGVATARAYTRVVLRRWIGITARGHGSAGATAGLQSRRLRSRGPLPRLPTDTIHLCDARLAKRGGTRGQGHSRRSVGCALHDSCPTRLHAIESHVQWHPQCSGRQRFSPGVRAPDRLPSHAPRSKMIAPCRT